MNDSHKVPNFDTHTKHGYATAFELAIRFHLWCQSLRRTPTVEEIMRRWDIHRSTAYRWRDGYIAATGRVGVESE